MKFGSLDQTKRKLSRLWMSTKQKRKNMMKRTRLIVVGAEVDEGAGSVILGVEVEVVEVMVGMTEDTIKIDTVEVEMIINGNTILVGIEILTVRNDGTLILALQVQRDDDMMNILGS